MKATEVTAGLAKSNDSLLPCLWRDSLHVTCGLTACTPGSAPGPTLGNECGKTLPLPFYSTTCKNQALLFLREFCPEKNYLDVLDGMFSGYGVRGAVAFGSNEIIPVLLILVYYSGKRCLAKIVAILFVSFSVVTVFICLSLFSICMYLDIL